jgi:hypothetical protein
MVSSPLAPARSVSYLLEVMGFNEAVFTLGKGGQDKDQLEDGEEGEGQHSQPRYILLQ